MLSCPFYVVTPVRARPCCDDFARVVSRAVIGNDNLGIEWGGLGEGGGDKVQAGENSTGAVAGGDNY